METQNKQHETAAAGQNRGSEETIYCMNEPCQVEAVIYYIAGNGARMPLCFTCKEAFQLGRANETAELEPIGD